MLLPRVHVLDRGDAKQPPVLVAILGVAFGMSLLTARDGRKVPVKARFCLALKPDPRVCAASQSQPQL